MSDENEKLPEPSETFGSTPPPADGSTQPCPSCHEGYQYIGGLEEGEIRCYDCYGTGRQGAGWIENQS